MRRTDVQCWVKVAAMIGVALALGMGSVDAAVFFVHTDHLGTPLAVTNGGQQKVWAATSDAFGQANVNTATVTNNVRFPGQYFDAELGTHYNLNRDYDPQTGRYLQSDPIGLDGGINTYAYVGSNPVRWADPLGLFNPGDEQRADGFADLLAGYTDMRRANWAGGRSDLYFHCKSHCRASRRGEGGQQASGIGGAIRELMDQYIKGNSEEDCAEDYEANDTGRRGDPNKICEEVCQNYRPENFPPEY